MPLLSIPPCLPPIVYWNTLQLVTGLTATFTPGNSRLRPLAAASTAVLAYLLTTNIQTHFAATRPSGPTVAMCWVNVLNAIDLLIISRASYNKQLEYNKTKAEKKDQHTEKDTLFKKLTYALILPYNLRRINTPYQISRLPAFSPSNPKSTPTRKQFLLESLFKLAISIILIQILVLPPTNMHLVSALSNLNESKSVLWLQDYDLATVFLQARFSLSFGIVTRAAIVGGYTAGALLAVLFGSHPSEWPPIAGVLSGAWSLGRLWGTCWHQLLRRPLTSNATYISSLLGLSPTGSGAHWIRVITAFLASGVIHALMDIGFGVEYENSGAILFFGVQIAGLALETVFQNVFGGTIRGLKERGMIGGWTVRGFGFVWVSGFLLWGAPVWINPILVSLNRDGTNVMSPWLGFKAGSF